MANKTKNPVPQSKLGLDKINSGDDISLPAQRQRLLEWLRSQPITTIQARRLLNILAPAPRIWELRHNERYNIVTNFVEDITTEGKPHCVAQYSLLSGKWRDKKPQGGDYVDL